MTPGPLAESRRHMTPEVIDALEELIERAITFGGDYSQAWISLQVEKRQVKQVSLVPVPGFSIRIPNGGRGGAGG
jgi:hypothetical protein